MLVNQFTFIIPWKSGNPDREKSFKNMLNCLIAQDYDPTEPPFNYEVIVVEQVTEERKEAAQKKFMDILPQELATRHKYIQLVSNSPFNKSWCMNVGSKLASYNDFIFADADSLLGLDFLRKVQFGTIQFKAPANQIFICWNYIICLPGKDNLISRHMTPELTRTLGGIWFVTKDFYFNKMGGMNENFSGYGAEDNEAYERACHILKRPSIECIHYPLAHQYHDWEKPSPHAVRFFDLFTANYNEVIKRLKGANLGNPEKPTLINYEDLKG